MALFERLIRFVDEKGDTRWGDFGSEEVGRDVEGKGVKVLEGSLETGFKATGEQGYIHKVNLVCPL